jgi:hypothetical protein
LVDYLTPVSGWRFTNGGPTRRRTQVQPLVRLICLCTLWHRICEGTLCRLDSTTSKLDSSSDLDFGNVLGDAREWRSKRTPAAEARSPVAPSADRSVMTVRKSAPIFGLVRRRQSPGGGAAVLVCPAATGHRRIRMMANRSGNESSSGIGATVMAGTAELTTSSRPRPIRRVIGCRNNRETSEAPARADRSRPTVVSERACRCEHRRPDRAQPDNRGRALMGGDPIMQKGYPLHMVLAKKIVTALQRGVANTRWRDFGDIWSLSRSHAPTKTNGRDTAGESP